MASENFPSYGSPGWDVPLAELARGQDKHKLLTEAAAFVCRPQASGQENSYVSKLRFLAPVQTKLCPKAFATPMDNLIDPFSDCICSNYMPFTAADYLEKTPSLVLTDPGAFAGCKHYAAISYCWQQPEMYADFDPGVPPPTDYRIHVSGVVRTNRAPASVIHRAIIYAAAHGFCFLWIDQECINQDDLVEKAEAIQQMDVVYRQAKQTVAILSNPFMKQEHLDTIGAIGSTRRMHHTSVTLTKDFKRQQKRVSDHIKKHGTRLYYLRLSPREGLRSVVECAELISGDPWHSRAWTLQETLVAGGPLHFLIPCHQTLERPTWMTWNIPGNIILSETFIQRTMEYRLPHYEEHNDIPNRKRIISDVEFQELQQRGNRCKEVLFKCPTYKLNGDISRRPDLARLSAADACKLLIHRNLLDPYDLLAITGNVCLYPVRLDIGRVRDTGISPSVGIWTQSILNGDMSLLLALNAQSTAAKNDSFEFFYLGNSIAKALSDPMSQENPPLSSPLNMICRIKQVQVTPTGLRVKGSLWRFDTSIDFSEMLKTHTGNDRTDTFWAVLSYLQASKMSHLAKAILSIFRPPDADITDEELQSLLDERRPGSWSTSHDPLKRYDSFDVLQKFVDMVINNRKLVLGVMESSGRSCFPHKPIYILVDHEPPSQTLLALTRDLVMSESASDTPSFLFNCWVTHRSRPAASASELRPLESPKKLDVSWGCGDFSKHMLVCGNLRHFSSCLGEEYDLLWV